MSELKEFDISHELWREYQWVWRENDICCCGSYRIKNPKLLFIRPNGTTHRIVDSDGVVHCVPSVGVMGCVLKWKNPDGTPPVNF